MQISTKLIKDGIDYIFRFIFLFILPLNSYSYVVNKKETLSEIARRNISKSVYGKNGSLKKILDLNPEITNPDVIIPGQVIRLEDLPEIELAESKSEKEIVQKNQIEHNDNLRSFAQAHLANYFFNLRPEYSLMSLNAKDKLTNGKSIVASKYHISIEGSYYQQWSDSFRSSVFLKVGHLQFEDPTTSVRNLDKKERFFSKLGVETDYKFSSNFTLNSSLSFGSELFIRAASTSSDTVDVVNLPSLGIKTFYDLYQARPLTFGVSGLYRLKFPGEAESYNIEHGHEYGVSLYLRNDEEIFKKLFTEIGIRYRDQDTSVTSQQELNVFLGTSFSFGYESIQGNL
jgi:LysM repeat protein